MRHSKQAPKPPERAHFDAIGSIVVLFPGSWWYRMDGETHHVTDDDPRIDLRIKNLRKAIGDELYRPHAKYCVYKNRLSFFRDWKIQITKTVYFTTDGKELPREDVWNYHDDEGRGAKRREVELPESEWVTCFHQGIPCELREKLYGPLKILV